ncbi:PIN domain-containing protein [candidate division KSB1 bacterium]|nr:PIN domain-containing protein [candidate division KSB1 bacterium]
MSYLLDNCVISELVKSEPNDSVVKWIRAVPDSEFYLSVITMGELYKGVEKLGQSRRQVTLTDWIESNLLKRFENRILHIDLLVMQTWAKIQASAEASGRNMPAIDSLIAATARAHDLIVVTRDIKDMQASGVKLFDPWTTDTG